eukprot:scaffold119345_cov72-Phaeocystis_antarctica.AAC.7
MRATSRALRVQGRFGHAPSAGSSSIEVPRGSRSRITAAGDNLPSSAPDRSELRAEESCCRAAQLVGGEPSRIELK